ncbi:glycosyltransferase 87 family protein [Gordonia soli]|uniref:Putative glycosyltransferase n=1 Tax=Gordonia soli NBRC 108243 TaxID=1223545 RepID=M0QJZ8_9ACTN|nr:glycosyltransferase 87 family protein [Gordonia soli]GAC68853.1 putative glycosyltransferase [Gordonia soli NBRC 108243]
MSTPDATVNRPERTTILQWWAVGAAALAAVAVVIWHLTAISPDNPFYALFGNLTDLRVYRAGGQAIIDGRPLYTAPVLWGLDFTYPPLSALVFVPFAAMGQTAASLVWWSATFVALAATIGLSLRSLGYRMDRRVALFALFLTVASTALEPVRTTIWLGQINVFLMLLVLVDLVLLDMIRPNSRLRGIGVGLAAGLKLTPGFFVLYLLATRRWRAAVTAVVTFVLSIVIGLVVIRGDASQYWTQYATGAARVGRVDSPANQSINGFISQLLAHFDIRRYAEPLKGIPVYEAPPWLWMPIAVVAAAAGLWAAWTCHRRGRELLAVTITGMTGATVSPFSWGHHWVWLVPLFVIAFDFAYRGLARGRSAWWRWLTPALIVVLSFTWVKHWYLSGPRFGSDHAIALGLFMMPRWPNPQWWDHLLVILYSGCYPLVLALTIVAVAVTELRERRAVVDAPACDEVAADDARATPATVRADDTIGGGAPASAEASRPTT